MQLDPADLERVGVAWARMVAPLTEFVRRPENVATFGGLNNAAMQGRPEAVRQFFKLLRARSSFVDVQALRWILESIVEKSPTPKTRAAVADVVSLYAAEIRAAAEALVNGADPIAAEQVEALLHHFPAFSTTTTERQN